MAAYELKYTAEEIDGILESVDEKTIYDDATQSAHGLMSAEDKSKLDALPTSQQIESSLSGKVDKENGKGLSTNDYDNTAKAKVDAIPADPKYTDTVYDDTALAGRVSTIEGKESGWDAKQDALASGTNIKTVNGESLLGSGNIEIQGGGEDNVIEAITMNGSSVPVTNKMAAITETDPTVPSWAKQPNKPSYNYSEIGNTPDLSGFITKSVNDLTNYYLKSETYTKAEVAALIGAIQQFHYEIYATLPQSGESNVLYLIGPTGTGADRYEEYVYSNSAFTKIGDTSIDLSGYVTTSALNTALQSYTPTSNLATVATSGSYNDLTNRPTIPDGMELLVLDEDEGTLTQEQITLVQSDHCIIVYDNEYYYKNYGDGADLDYILNYIDSTDNGICQKVISINTSAGSYSIEEHGLDIQSDWNESDSTSVAYIKNKPTIPTVPVQDVTVGGTSVVSSGTAAIPAIPTVPTISTDVATDKADNTKTTGAKAVYDAIHPAIATTEPSGGMLPNVLYEFGELSGNTTFTLAAPSDANIANHYYWTFDTPSTAPTITWPTGLTWFGGSAPTISASKHYEISVLNGIAIAMEV